MGDLEGVVLTPLKIIEVDDGNIFHALRASDMGFRGFGEAYFSQIHGGVIKPWKRHLKMTLNLVVIEGVIRFVVHDDRIDSETFGCTKEYRLGVAENYSRLTIPPMLWMAFEGINQGSNLLLNIANIEHNPMESERITLDSINFSWDKK